MRIIGWRLRRDDRARLLQAHPPAYERIIADHVTLDADAGHALLPKPILARLIGRADDGRGVEAMVVEIVGTIRRPTGGVYHITWSLSAGRRAVESNRVIADCGWKPTMNEMIELVPAELGRRATRASKVCSRSTH